MIVLVEKDICNITCIQHSVTLGDLYNINIQKLKYRNNKIKYDVQQHVGICWIIKHSG